MRLSHFPLIFQYYRYYTPRCIENSSSYDKFINNNDNNKDNKREKENKCLSQA